MLYVEKFMLGKIKEKYESSYWSVYDKRFCVLASIYYIGLEFWFNIFFIGHYLVFILISSWLCFFLKLNQLNFKLQIF